MKTFADQIAVVTGASSGIGRAIALALAEEGASLCLIGRDERRLQDLARAARRMNALVQSFRMDLTDDGEIHCLVTHLNRGDSGVHVLVLTSGAFHKGTIESTSVRELDHMYRTNVRAPYLLVQKLLPLLKSARGQIVFINSTQGLEAGDTVGPFAATQHALRALADSLRKEVNAEGIRVISFFYGRTATPRTEQIFASEGRIFQPELLPQPEDVAAMVINALSAPRTAEVTDVNIRPMQKTY